MTAPDRALLAALRQVELPTLGHFLEEGFCEPRIAPVGDGPRLAGVARTLDLREPDAYAVNRALVALRPGDVLMIRVTGGAHAPVGAVTAASALAQGAAGIVVDGPVTDAPVLRGMAGVLPVYSDGLTARTTKRTGTLDASVIDCPIEVGGVPVRPGDIVLGDAHGILILPPDGPGKDVLEHALASDAAEPALLARIAAGVPIDSLIPVAPDAPLSLPLNLLDRPR